MYGTSQPTEPSDQRGTRRRLAAHSSPTEGNRTPSVLSVYVWADTQMTRGLLCALARKVLTKLS